jgi:hypothetical protein
MLDTKVVKTVSLKRKRKKNWQTQAQMDEKQRSV